MTAAIAILLLLAQGRGELSEQAKTAANQAVETVDGWVNQANSVKEHLEHVKEKAEKLKSTQELLEAAVKSRDVGKLRDAIHEWFPEAAEKLDTVTDVELALKKINPAFGAALGNTLDEALLHFGEKARELNGRALQKWAKSGIGARIDRALEGEGRLGKAIKLGTRIKQTWDSLKEVKDKYDEVLKDIEGRFDPAAQDAFAGLRAIQGILQEFKDDAPPPVDRIIGFYADSVGAVMGALQNLETQLNQNSRQMNLMRSFDSTKDGVLKELRQKFPGENQFELTEIPTPEFLQGRYFHCREDRYYLYSTDKVLYQLNGTPETIRRVARMLDLVKKEVDPGRLESALPGFAERYKRVCDEYTPFYEACRESRAVFEAYLKAYYPGDDKTAESALQDVTRFHRWEFEEAMANMIFNEPDRSLLRRYGQLFLYNVLVEVSVSGSGPDFDPAKLSVWARPEEGSAATLRNVQGVFSGLVDVSTAKQPSIFFGGSHAGEALRETSDRLPKLPARVAATLAFTPRPKEPPPAAAPPPGPEDIEQIRKTNESGPLPPPPAPPVGPGTGSGTGEQPPGGGEEPPAPEGLKGKTGVDTDPGSAPDETGAKFGGRPTDLGDPGFDALLDRLLEGDRDGAEKILQKMTGCSKDRAGKEIGKLLGEDKTRKDFDGKGKGAKAPYPGPKPGPDGGFLSGVGVDPGGVGAPVTPGNNPDAPAPGDLAPPPGQDPATNPFDKARRAAAAVPDDFLRRQQGAADGERRAAADVIRKTPIPTRGGMDTFDVGNARQIVITVWDTGIEDGDMVRISVGGRVIAGSLVLTNAGQSFTVDISDTFTTVTVVALNEGTQPPNTAGIRVSAGGRDLKASSWSLKTNTVGSTVIRRGGAP